MPFIHEILMTLDVILCDLSPSQIQTFYSGIGVMIAYCQGTLLQEQEALITAALRSTLDAWNGYMNQMQQVDVLSHPEMIQQIDSILRIWFALASVSGIHFHFISLVKESMTHLYQQVSAAIQEACHSLGDVAVKTPRVRALRGIKKVLELYYFHRIFSNYSPWCIL